MIAGYELRMQGMPLGDPMKPGSCAKCPEWEEAPTGGVGICKMESLAIRGKRVRCEPVWTYPTDGADCEVE